MRASIFLATLLTGTLAAAAARADGPLGKPHPFEAMSEGSRVGFNTDIWPTENTALATMGITGQLQVVPGFVLDFDVPWAAGHYNVLGTTHSSAAFGNITLGGHGVFKVDPEAALHYGLSISIPTRYDFQNASGDYGAVALAASVTRGFYDAHRMLAGVLFVRIPLGIEVRLGDYFYYRGDLNPVILTSVAKNADHNPQVILEHADELELRAPFGLGLGLRFQAAFALSNFGGSDIIPNTGGFSAGDHAQTAMEPFVQYEPPGRGVFARAGGLFALDNPLGPGGEKGKLATIRLSVGGKF